MQYKIISKLAFTVIAENTIILQIFNLTANIKIFAFKLSLATKHKKHSVVRFELNLSKNVTILNGTLRNVKNCEN